MRADRVWCLRCHEKLEAAAPARPGPPSLREWLETTNPRNLIVGALASLALLAAVVLFMDSSMRRTGTLRPGAATPNGKPGAATTTGAYTPPQGERMSPATSRDAVRLGGAALVGGDFEAAKARYQDALQKNANDPEALNGLGLVLERQGQVDEAIDHYSRAAQISPTKWAYRFNLAHALAERGNWDRAVDEYRAASGLFPDDYATQYNLALALHKKGDDQAAVPEFRKAIVLAPAEPSFHLSLAMSLERTGNLSDARHEYEQYLAMNPSAADAEKIREHLKTLAVAKSS
jgi:Flp pilus assembly protein TadD